MNFDIYVLGDVNSFVSALNSVVMILSSAGFIGSAALLGALVGLMGFLIFLVNKEAGQQILKGGSPIVGLLIFFVFVTTINIKTKVTINDAYTGNTNVVNNVPALISMPASAISTAAYRIFDFSNTAFQGTDGSFIALGETGYVMPLQILNSLRQGMERVDPLLAASTKQFIIDCVPGGSVNPEALAAAPDALGYIFANARDNGLTTTFTSAAPSGAATSCVQAKEALADRSADLLHKDDAKLGNATKLEALVNAAVKEKNPNAAAIDGDQIADSVQRVMLDSMSGTALQTPDQFMLNVLFYNTLTNTFNCMDQAASQDAFATCDVMMTQASEQWKTDSAASASLFAKTMMPAMVFMQLMFYSLTPIVIVFGLIRGVGGIAMYVKFLGFGVWTASWLPVAAVIQMYIQNNVAGKVAQITSRAITPGNLKSVYYDVISTNLSIASDMLAATPLVTASILGVSSMAMSYLAKDMGGKDRVDEKLATPDIMRRAPAVEVSSLAQGNAGTGIVTSTGAAAPTMAFSYGNSAGIASAASKREADQQSIGSDLSASMSNAEQRTLSALKSNGSVTTMSGVVGYRTQDGQTVQFGSSAKSGEVEQALAKAAVNAQASMQLGSQINAAMVPHLVSAFRKGGKNITQGDASSLIQQSANQLASNDAGFMTRLSQGDEGAIGMLVEGAVTAASVAATLTTGPVGAGAAGAAQVALRSGGKQAIVAGVQKAIRSVSGAADRVSHLTPAIFNNTGAGLQTQLKASIAAERALSNTTSEARETLASDMTSWSRGDYQGQETSQQKSGQMSNSDASMRAASKQIAESFKLAESRTTASDASYQRNAQASVGGGTKWEGSAEQFVQFMRANPEIAKDLAAQIKAAEPLIAGDAARMRQMIDNSVKSGMTNDERNLAAGAMALQGLSGGAGGAGFNLATDRNPAGMSADSNAGMTGPNVDSRINQASAAVPQPGQVQAPRTAPTPGATGTINAPTSYRQPDPVVAPAPAAAPAAPAAAPAPAEAAIAPASAAGAPDRSIPDAPSAAATAGGNVPPASTQVAQAAGAPQTHAGGAPAGAARPAGNGFAGGAPVGAGGNVPPASTQVAQTVDAPQTHAGGAPAGADRPAADGSTGGAPVGAGGNMPPASSQVAQAAGAPQAQAAVAHGAREALPPTEGQALAAHGGAASHVEQGQSPAPLVSSREEQAAVSPSARQGQPDQAGHASAEASAAATPTADVNRTGQQAPTNTAVRAESTSQPPAPAASRQSSAPAPATKPASRPAAAQAPSNPQAQQPAQSSSLIGAAQPSRPNIAQMRQRFAVVGSSTDELAGSVSAGPGSKRPDAPDANSLNITDPMSDVYNTTAGKVIVGTTAAVAGVNILTGIAGGVAGGRGGAKGGAGGAAPGQAGGAAGGAPQMPGGGQPPGGASQGARTNPNGSARPVLTGGSGQRGAPAADYTPPRRQFRMKR